MEFAKENSLARVNFTGGLLGLLAGSQFLRIESVIEQKNRDGWNLAEVIPENRNLIIWILRLILLVLTLGLWTLSTGHILVFERPSRRDQDLAQARRGPSLGRVEPALSSPRPSI